VVAAYDFSQPPANGGTWKWGSTSSSPKTTVFAMNEATHGPFRALDTSVYPPGSSASLRFDVPQGTGERADAWRISLDNYADQFGENGEFWVQWRVRMNASYATYNYLATDGRSTGYKLMMVAAGMQSPYVVAGQPRGSYGYSAGGSMTDNVIQDARIDSQGEIVIRDRTAVANASHANNFKYPISYISKYFDDTLTIGGNNFTWQNGGGEASPYSNAACWFGQNNGDQYLSAASCFQFPVDEWFTLMAHVKLGAYQANATSSIAREARTGYANSSIELYGALQGQQFRLLHRRTGIVMPVDTGTPQGAQGIQKYGQFGFTTFMTHKDPAQSHPTGQYWIGQVLVRSGATSPAPPL
jgi:hypothetical protein